MDKQHIVFLTGAGISAESGLSTFRGKDGMWTNEEWVYPAATVDGFFVPLPTQTKNHGYLSFKKTNT